jgi:hypothetical protein
MKALMLNGFRDPGYDRESKYDPMLKAASSPIVKPTLKISRVRTKPLQTKDNNYWAREVQKQVMKENRDFQKEDVQKAMSLNGI